MELSAEKLIPPDFAWFLTMVMAGKKDMESSVKMKHLVFSIGQDMCRAVSDEK